MIYLALSILASTSIYAVFKFLGAKKIKNFQAIVINYFVAASFGFAFNYSQGVPLPSTDAPWMDLSVVIGVFFIGMFYLMAIISQNIGVSVASVASKMAMVIPVVFFILVDPNESVTLYKILGVALGILSVYLVVNKSGMANNPNTVLKSLPILLFLGSGIVDVFLAHSEAEYLQSEAAFLQFIPVIFLTAGLIGILWLGFRLVTKKDYFQLKSLLGGLLLGLANYASIFFLLKTLDQDFLDRSSIFPANNMGIVALSALMGLVVFKEKLSVKNFIGIGLAILAIVILTLGEIGI